MSANNHESPEQLALKMRPSYLAFAKHYLITSNASEAIRKIKPGILPQSARRIGLRIKSHPSVSTFIHKMQLREAGATIMALDERRELNARVARGESIVDRTVTTTEDDGSVRVSEHSMSRERALKHDSELAGDINANVSVGIDVGSLLERIGESAPFVDVEQVVPTLDVPDSDDSVPVTPDNLA